MLTSHLGTSSLPFLLFIHSVAVVLLLLDAEVNCIKIGLPGKSILRDYFQENRTSRRPFLVLRISFPRRPILYNSSLEGLVKVAARQVRPHQLLVLLEAVPRCVGSSSCRAPRGSLDVCRGGSQAPGGAINSIKINKKLAKKSPKNRIEIAS